MIIFNKDFCFVSLGEIHNITDIHIIIPKNNGLLFFFSKNGNDSFEQVNGKILICVYVIELQKINVIQLVCCTVRV